MEGEQQQCPGNRVYDDIIDKAARNIFDPEWLGDLKQLRTKYNCQIKSNEDALRFADEVLRLPNDKYTDLLLPEEAEARQKNQRGTIKGVGILFGTDQQSKGPHKLVDVYKGGPAERAGIKPGDIITSVNGQELTDKTVAQTVSLILDAPSDDIRLGVIRDGKLMNFEMKREVVNIPAVESKMLEGDVAHITIKTFAQMDAAEELKQAIESMKGAKSFIIDLRDNPGGFTNQAMMMASLFLDNGRLLTQRERADSPPENPEYDTITYDLTADKIDGKRVSEEHGAELAGGVSDLERYPDLIDVPVVVLVNGNSASSAEIFTGALKDHRVATVMGERTYGKGIGQTVWSGMPEGTMLQTTTFRYYTPNGTWVGDAQNERYGITPDIEVKMDAGAVKGTASDNQLRAALDFLSMRK